MRGIVAWLAFAGLFAAWPARAAAQDPDVEPVYLQNNLPHTLQPWQVNTANWVHVKSPGPRMKFTAGLPLRVFADAIDLGAWQVNYQGWPKVEYLVDGVLMGSQDSDQAGRGQNYFEMVINGVAAGPHMLGLRGRFYGGGVETAHEIPIVVEAPPVKGTTLDLAADVVLSGAASQTWDSVRINGNGFRIRSAAGWSGSLTMRDCFVTGLGNMTASGIDATTQGGSITVETSVFEWTGAVFLGASGAGSIVVKDNEFRANNQITLIGANPDYSPMVRMSGNPSGPKVFRGNRVGIGWAEFQGMNGAVIGGATDAEGNVFIGARGGIYVRGCQNTQIRGNYSNHNYQGGWSQGFNFRFENSSNTLCEHNVIRGGSWPLQSFQGEFRYNLMVDSGHNWIRGCGAGSRLHHNLFIMVSQQSPYEPNAGVWMNSGDTNVAFHSNTLDGGGALMTWEGEGIQLDGSVTSLRNNVFDGFVPYNSGAAKTIVQSAAGAVAYADYNAFWSPGATNNTRYSPTAVPGKSVGQPGFGANDQQSDTRFALGRIFPYPVREGDLWNRVSGISQALLMYRARYTPGTGSPLIDAGDPADGPGVDIGAVGAGVNDPLDLFGKYGTPANPPTVTITNPT
ncbi:MAG TPA: right-handed parallel beta-helix repeat-containing protein, partial [Planctomycetota bacterium]|nr:right-handed parallel beta-helix repeat-containing protein [Planctomycetota bacterium]